MCDELTTVSRESELSLTVNLFESDSMPLSWDTELTCVTDMLEQMECAEPRGGADSEMQWGSTPRYGK